MQGDDNDRNERKRKNKNRKRVDLNVGGETFSTSLATLTSHPKSLFAEIFSGSFEEDLDSDGSYFIDRDPVVFLHVLNYLREQLIPVDTLSVRERDALLADAEYYQLPLLAGLVMEKQKEMAVERRDNKKEKKPRKASNSDGDEEENHEEVDTKQPNKKESSVISKAIAAASKGAKAVEAGSSDLKKQTKGQTKNEECKFCCDSMYRPSELDHWLKWHKKINVLHHIRKAWFSYRANNHHSAVIGCKTVTSGVHRWAVQILVNHSANPFMGNIMIGLAPADVDIASRKNYKMCGWYINCRNSKLHSGPPHNCRGLKYGSTKRIGAGQVVEVELDVDNALLSFAIDGESRGVAYSGLPKDKPFRLCVILYEQGDSVQIVAGMKKNKTDA